jgi:hypothetical protein
VPIRLDHVNLPARDPARLAGWYAELPIRDEIELRSGWGSRPRR